MVWDGTSSVVQPVSDVGSGSYNTVNSSNVAIPSVLAGVVFTAPPSGNVIVVASAYVKPAGDGGNFLILCMPEVREGAVLRSGTIVHAANTNESFGSASQQLTRGSSTAFVRGLTPGDEYNAYFAVFTNSTGAATAGVQNSLIRVEPF